MTTGYEAFQIFHAINLHFNTESYDYFKYRGKSNVNHNMWYARNDKYHFEVLGSKFKPAELIGIFVSFFLNHPESKPWGGELMNWSKSGYIKWIGNIEKMHITFESDLNYIKHNHRSIVKIISSSKGSTPDIINLIIQNKIDLATVVILLDIVNGAKNSLYKCDDIFIWPKIKNQIEKYRPFINFDKQKYIDITKRVFLS